LHGKDGSVDRLHNAYGTSTLTADAARLRYNRRALSQSPVTLRAQQRALVEEAIRETSEIRKWSLWAVNVRTNHIHTVVTANCTPERVVNAFKANSTRQLREAKCWNSERSPWSQGGSKRYLWTEDQLVKVKGINEKFSDDFTRWKADTAISVGASRNRMKQMRDDRQEQLKAVLTKAQWDKWTSMKSKAMEKRRKRWHGKTEKG